MEPYSVEIIMCVSFAGSHQSLTCCNASNWIFEVELALTILVSSVFSNFANI